MTVWGSWLKAMGQVMETRDLEGHSTEQGEIIYKSNLLVSELSRSDFRGASLLVSHQ
jgi:hypothetical protein